LLFSSALALVLSVMVLPMWSRGTISKAFFKSARK
jgi:hypothetical protein